jgi:hypothetical protein
MKPRVWSSGCLTPYAVFSPSIAYWALWSTVLINHWQISGRHDSVYIDLLCLPTVLDLQFTVTFIFTLQCSHNLLGIGLVFNFQVKRIDVVMGSHTDNYSGWISTVPIYKSDVFQPSLHMSCASFCWFCLIRLCCYIIYLYVCAEKYNLIKKTYQRVTYELAQAFLWCWGKTKSLSKLPLCHFSWST